MYSVANHCDAAGQGAYPSVFTMARETRLSERQVQRSIQNLQVIGELEVLPGLGPRGTNYLVIKRMIRPHCWYCGKDLFLSDRTVDHQNPVTRGGTNDLKNLVYACLICNTKKGTRTLPEYKVAKDGCQFFGETEEGSQFVTRPKSYGVTFGKPRGTTNPDSRNKWDRLSPKPLENPEPSEKETTEPPIVPVSVWLNFVEMRKKSRKPLTERAGELVRLELAKFKERGFDPVEILENSIRNGWLDVYEPREGTKNGARQATTRGATRAEQRVTEADRQSERVFGRTSGLVGSLRPDLQGRSDGTTGGGLSGDAPRLAGKNPAPSLPASATGVSAVPPDTGTGIRNSGKPAGPVREPAKVPG